MRPNPEGILIEPGPSIARVVNYIHLNPVRAHLLPVADLARYPWSSYRRFLAQSRPPFLVCKDWLAELGLTNSAIGWQTYHQHLQHLAGDSAEQRRQGFDTFDYGWAIGEESWRKDVAADHRDHLADLAIRGADECELKHMRWDRALDLLLATAGHKRDSLHLHSKGAPWKVEIADLLRRATGASIPWIARKLHMGAPSSVRVYLSVRSRAKINN
jgi:putative transposase